MDRTQGYVVLVDGLMFTSGLVHLQILCVGIILVFCVEETLTRCYYLFFFQGRKEDPAQQEIELTTAPSEQHCTHWGQQVHTYTPSNCFVYSMQSYAFSLSVW